MEIKLCRICGKQDDSFIHIFKTEGLKNKIETCLPIVITQQCSLPDTICTTCLDAVDNFYSFIKNCLQNIIVLEAQYEIVESCLKTKRKVDRSVSVDPCELQPPLLFSTLNSKIEIKEEIKEEVQINSPVPNAVCGLVDYDYSSSESEDEMVVVVRAETEKQKPVYCDKFVDDSSKDIIDEIVQRKYLKRKHGGDLICGGGPPKKQVKHETNSGSVGGGRRKSSKPKRVEYHLETETANKLIDDDFETVPVPVPVPLPVPLPMVQQQQQQTCLLCEQRLPGLLALAAHMYETHGIDLSQVYGPTMTTATAPTIANQTPLPAPPPAPTSSTPLIPPLPTLHPAPTAPPPSAAACRNRKIPELVKISDVLATKRHKNTQDQIQQLSNLPEISLIPEPKLDRQPAAVLNSKYVESRQQFQQQQFVCGDCPLDSQRSFDTFSEFSTHRRAQHQIFHCDLCPKFYGRNSHLWKHVNRVHKGHAAITCRECGKTSASEYHLAQHRNKMHSSTQSSSGTTSKYQRKRKEEKDLLAAESIASRLKEETATTIEETNEENIDKIKIEVEDEDDLLNQKFQGFDFKSVRQSFLRQELISKRQRYVSVLKKNNVFGDDDGPLIPSRTIDDDSVAIKTEPLTPPKEIDSSSDLYTTIITNYTPPSNEGPYKCPKCFKGFHKKNLLKKHKKNCRPRLQKDLLTRCKTCSRIFKDRQSLAKHLVNYHSEYTCEICSLAVQSKCEIVSHIRFTHPGSELHCNCGQILRSRADLARHRAEHRDSHVCQFCGDALPTKIKLKMHILSLHRKILALSCGICLRLFETQHILRAHVRHAHADQLRPLTSCTVCGKNYGSKWKTYDHLNKSHGRIFRACKVCLEVFETERDLQVHFERDHVNNAANTTTSISSSNTHSKNNHHSTANKEQHPNTHARQRITTTTITTQSSLQNSHQPPPLPSSQQTQQRRSVVPPASELDDDESRAGVVAAEEDADDEGDYFRNFMSRELAKAIDKRNGVAGGDNNKLSLLEKRLLGKKAKEDDTTVTITKTNNRKDNGKNGNATDWEQETSFTNQNSADDILQNSSKRTVYVNSNDPSLCEICLKVWPAKKHLWQHYIRCHKQTAATVCGICLKTNPSYSALQRHLRDTHPRLLHGCGFGSNFICKICGRYHNASSKLRLHMAIHVGYPGEGAITSDQEQQSQQQSTLTVSHNDNIPENTIKHEAEDEAADDEDEDEVEDSEDEDDEQRAEEDDEIVQKVKEEPSINESEDEEEVEDDEDGGDDENESADSEVEDEQQTEQTNHATSPHGIVTVTVKNEIHHDVDEETEEAEEYEEADADINYESMIEEVEASDVELDEIANGGDRDGDGEVAPSSSEDETSRLELRSIIKVENESDEIEENEMNNENEMEKEMLKNMIGESRSVRLLHIQTEQQDADDDDDDDEEDDDNNDKDPDVQGIDDEDAEYEDDDVLEDDVTAYEVELVDSCDVDIVKNENCSDMSEVEEDGDSTSEQWTREVEQEGNQVDELDSAIRSICDADAEEEDEGGGEVIDGDDDDDDNVVTGSTTDRDAFRRLISGRVNETELETAVGSIL